MSGTDPGRLSAAGSPLPAEPEPAPTPPAEASPATSPEPPAEPPRKAKDRKKNGEDGANGDARDPLELEAPGDGEDVKQGRKKEGKKNKEGKEPGEAGGKEAKGKKDKSKKRAKKWLEKLREAMAGADQPLGAWERYRALVDAFDMEQDLVDLADHKARFALVILGGLNTLTLYIGTRTEIIAVAPPALRPLLALYVGAYALLALFFFVQAIESLRPRAPRPNVPYPGAEGLEDHPLGLRFYGEILNRDAAAYRQAWRRLHLGQLNAEVAHQVRLVATINEQKYAALTRLYSGLKVMTLAAAVLVTVLAGLALARERNGGWHAAAAAAGPSAAGAVQGPAAPAAAASPADLGGPVVFRETGALEPSGITFVPSSGRLWVVGDEGSLVELDQDGRTLRSEIGKGNLEDLAFHAPSGRLVLLSEKKSQLLFYDPVARRDLGKVKLDLDALVAAVPGDRNQGFEGLAFRPVPGRPGGGIFYLTHQRQPATIVAISFDPSAPPAELGAAAVVTRFKIKGYKDLTAITWSEELQRLLVIGDDKDKLLVLKDDGKLEAEVRLPGLQQEGLCFDDKGRLWVADDRGGVLRIDGGLEAIRGQLGTGAPGATEAQ